MTPMLDRDLRSAPGSRLSFKYVLYLFAAWTCLIAASAAWNTYQIRQDTLEKARIEARTVFEHNLAYRRWNAKHGGVYAPVTGSNPPNKYIVSPDRDITTATGKRLTLINPFQMTRQAYDLLHRQSPLAAINRTVSLHPVNPENEPDPWERKALMEFEKGRTEVSELTAIGGAPFMRILKPYITVKGCLKCHGSQGYKVGDIRGAMSIAIPMDPYLESEPKSRMTVAGTHLLIWAFGTLGIAAFWRSIQRQQRRTAESAWKFRTLSEFAQDWEYWITEGNRVVYMSPSCARITGHSPDEFIRNPALLRDIIHPEERERYLRHIEEGRTKPDHEEMDFRIITKDGQIKRLFHVCAPIFSEGRYLGRHVSNRDITDRKQLEEQLMQSQKMESLGLFAGGIAHDFNNLLTVITGYASMLRRKLAGSDPAVGKYLNDMLAASAKARSLTSSLLAFGRKQVMKRTAASLNGIIANISGLLKRIIGEDIELRIKYAEREFPVFADTHQIEQVLMNLMSNARDAMPRGGILTVETETFHPDRAAAERCGAAPGRYMMLRVSDSGAGIEEKDLPHIFDPFFTTKEVGKGTGLGLAMVYGIIKQHGGAISVESAPGVGTVFRVCLPASQTAESGESDQGRASASNLRGSETILVAEDEEAVRAFLKEILESYGYTAVSAVDGDDAIEKYREHKSRIDLVLLDAVLPKRTARDVYEVIRKEGGGAKALFMSGYMRDILVTRGLLGDGAEFVSKPLDAEKLLTAIRGILAGRGDA